jgi:hypothetical protein
MIDSGHNHQNTFGTCTFVEFKVHVSEFFALAKTATAEQIEHGFKALTIFYFGLDEGTSELDLHQAGLLLEMAGREVK